MVKWDRYRAVRDEYISRLVQRQKQKKACKTWIVLANLYFRLQACEMKLKEHREVEAAIAKEEDRKRKQAALEKGSEESEAESAR